MFLNKSVLLDTMTSVPGGMELIPAGTGTESLNREGTGTGTECLNSAGIPVHL